MKRFSNWSFAWVIASTIAVSCTDHPSAPSLYSRMGELDAMKSLVDSFLVNINADTTINAYFSDTYADQYRLLNFRNHLVDQFCELSGGPCIYKGKPMAQAHEGMNISIEHFDAMIQDLVTALDSNAIAAPEKAEFMSLLSTLKTEIVQQ